MRPIGLAVALSLCFACEKDPNDARTWVDKLDSPAHWDEAIRHLERLKDPSSIPALGKLWKKTNRNWKVLRVIITIAKHKDEKSGKAHFENAIPILKEAVEQFDPSDERSIDDAMVACDALGLAGDASTIQTLIGAARKPVPKLSPANRARIAAVKALGQFRDPRAVEALVQVLGADPEKERVEVLGAAALALAETGDPKALPVLKKALFNGLIANFAHRAVTRIGKPAIPVMLGIYQEKDPEILTMAKDKKWMEPTKAPGTMIYSGAMALGNLRAKDAAKALAAGLSEPARVAYHDGKGNPGPLTHMAILRSLQMIGDPQTAAAVYAYAMGSGTDDGIRPVAIDVYSWLARDGAALPQLLSYIRDPAGEDQLRMVSILAYGRIARTEGDARELDGLIKDYGTKVKAAEEKVKAAKTPIEKNVAESEKATAAEWQAALQETRYRVEMAVACKTDAACYGAALDAKDVSPGKPGMPKAERALIELYKMGEAGRAALPSLLKHSDSSERIVREGVNLALPRVAPSPCADCAARLKQVLDSQTTQTTLDSLNADTRVVYNYFR